MAEERVRVEIGFDGGQIMGALVSASDADGLEEALAAAADGDATFSLEAEDGRYVLALRRIVYVKRFSRDTHIGFGGTP